MTVEVIDPVADYAALMQKLFDFDAIRDLFAAASRMRFDGMGAITGPYGTAILEGLLGAPKGTVMNGTRCRISAATIPIPTSFMPRNSAIS